MLWSSTTIDGPPRVLLIDASANLAGWESAFCDRLLRAMAGRGVRMVADAPMRVGQPDDLRTHARALESSTCLVLIAHGSGDHRGPAADDARHYWRWLTANVAGPKLVAVCSWASYEPGLTEEILAASNEMAPLALAQRGPVAEREAGLFLLKFFSELHLHAEEQITGRMTWFAWSKARELLKRRRLNEASFGLRA